MTIHTTITTVGTSYGDGSTPRIAGACDQLRRVSNGPSYDYAGQYGRKLFECGLSRNDLGAACAEVVFRISAARKTLEVRPSVIRRLAQQA
jgi:hypothetical protein